MSSLFDKNEAYNMLKVTSTGPVYTVQNLIADASMPETACRIYLC